MSLNSTTDWALAIDSVTDALCMLDSHLICHPHDTGFYVPIDFDEPLFSEDQTQVPGGMLGSSQGLMRELVAVAPRLGIALADGRLADAKAERVNAMVKAESAFWIDHCVWLKQCESARLSVEHGSAIEFG